jgi:very-short-patch-repair endonuclease
VPNSWTPVGIYETAAIQMLFNCSLASKYIFLSNVPLQDIFAVNRRIFIQTYRRKPHWPVHQSMQALRRSAYIALQGQIGKKMVDILVCDKQTGRIVGGIEIDGSHHRNQPQQDWDLAKNMLFATAGFPLLRFSISDVFQCKPQALGGAGKSFNALLTRASNNWNSFVLSPSLYTMQLHRP